MNTKSVYGGWRQTGSNRDHHRDGLSDSLGEFMKPCGMHGTCTFKHGTCLNCVCFPDGDRCPYN